MRSSITKRLAKLEKALKANNFVPVAIIEPGGELPPGVTDKTVIIIDDIGLDDEIVGGGKGGDDIQHT